MAQLIWLNFFLYIGLILNKVQVFGYNLDTINYIRHEHRPDSMFGFSVALHYEQGRPWILVGAPKSDTSRIQANVYFGGAVYRCEISDDDSCFLIPFDKKRNNYNDNGEQVDNKSYQWFGATVVSAGVDGPIVACAPRYVYYTNTPRKNERVEPVGTCFISKRNFTDFTEYSPCRTSFWGYHRQGSCQAGFSAAISNKGDRLYVGAPGSWYWQGQVYSINTDAVYDFKPERRYDKFGLNPIGQLYARSLNDPKAKVYETAESTANEDDSYLGYSSVTGDFDGDGEQGVAVGMPRGSGLLGKVVIMTWDLKMQHNMTGEQIGAYFGYSLAVVDVDGDKLDDIIVGAPMYTEPNNEGNYEMGRVYILFQSSTNPRFGEIQTREGIRSKARFGLSLCSLSDINLDGYGDFAVGAPYDGEHGRGVVYIYHGSKTGPLEKPSQIIHAEDVSGVSMTTFGFSVGGGIDIDDNLYPDLVVGAYESGVAITFKSREVVVMEATTRFQTDSKLISIEDPTCTLHSENKNVTCTSVEYCFRYDGKNVPEKVVVDVSLLLDSKKSKQPRMFFLTDPKRSFRNFTLTLYDNVILCQSQNVYVTDNIRDKLTPLEVEMNYELRSNKITQTVRRKRHLLGPVLEQNHGTTRRDSINIQKNCGPDNTCIPDLRLEINTVDKYFLGSKEALVFDVMITNNDEDAFEAGFFMTIPQGFSYNKIERIGEFLTSITCTAPTANNNVLKCDLGNPLSKNNVANFRVFLSPTAQKKFNTPNLEIYMEANSTNPERDGNRFDNVIKKAISIQVLAEWEIEGNSDPKKFLYNASEYKDYKNVKIENDIGPEVHHLYSIRNKGPATIEGGEVFVLWSIKTNEGDELMYLLEQPETYGNIKCDFNYNVNPANVHIDRQYSRKSYLERAGVVMKVKEKSSFYQQRYGGGYVITTTSSNSSSTVGGGTSSTTIHRDMTEEEKLKDEHLESTGDASFVHRERQKNVGQSGGGGSGNSYYWETLSGGRGPITHTSHFNRTTYTDAHGNVRVVESSTEYSTDYNRGAGGVSSGQTSEYRENQSGRTQIHANGQQAHISGQHGNQGHSQSGGRQVNWRHNQSTTFDSRDREHDNRDRGASHQQGHINGQHSGQIQSGQGHQSQHQSQSGQSYQGGSYTGSYGSQQSNSANRYNSHGELISKGNFQDDVNQDISDLNSRSELNLAPSQTSGRRRMHSQQDGEPYQAGLITGAQSGQGFQTTSFDLGINTNTDSELRKQGETQFSGGSSGGRGGGSSGSTSYSTQYSSSSGTGGGQGGGSGSSSSYYTSSSSRGGGSGGRSGSSTHYSSQQYPAGSVQSEHYSGSSHINQHLPSNIEPIDSRFKHYDRFKREADDLDFSQSIICNNTKCAALRCTIGQLKDKEEVWLALRFRIVAKTVQKVAGSSEFMMSSMALSRITKLPYVGKPATLISAQEELFVTAIPEPEPKEDIIPLWVFVLSAVVGAIILLLIIYLLYKCGFFKRKRPSGSSQERQPLNRNGNYHGDEHL